MVEKQRVSELLRSLCSGIESPPQRRGRPRIPLSEAAFAAVMKVYGGASGRRSTTDMREYEAKGLLGRPVHYNSISNALESEALTPILKALIEQSAAPLRSVESEFAIDSSGFSSSIYARYFHEKYGGKNRRPMEKRQWVKLHAMVGVKTNIVTAVEVTNLHRGDCPELPDLVDATASRFRMERVSADKAYGSKLNVEHIENHGATPFIPFKATIRGDTKPYSAAWDRMFHYFSYRSEEFTRHYHKRSNVETAFAMIKAKFGGYVRSKTFRAQVNEVLCKVLAHNLCCLVGAMFELGIEPAFLDGPSVA
jgi:transposase